MARRDPNAIDLSQTKVCLAEDVVVWPVRERGKLVYRLEIPSLHRFFRVGYHEYVFISLLDGKTTVPQACGLAASQLGKQAPTTEQANAIQRWLLKTELAYISGGEQPTRDPLRPTPGAPPKSLLSQLNPFWMKLTLCRDGSWIRALAHSLRACFATISVVIGCLVIAVGLMMLVSNWGRFSATTTEVFSPNNWLWLLASWVVLKIVHELGHAICCHRQGGEVHELGVVFILFAPLVYVDVTSCWRMPSRWRRIAVSSAGMFVELVIAAIAVMLWARTESAQTEYLLYNLIFTAGLSTLLFNANPLMRFDGYFILADLIEIPNLYAESSSEVRRQAMRFVFGQRPTTSHYSGWRLGFIRLYGICALIWRVVICTSLAIAASAMFAGAGVLIALAGVGLWFYRPIKDLLRFCGAMFRTEPARLIRGGIVGGFLTLVAIGMLTGMPIPTAVRVPAIARYLPETLIRSAADGFVRQVHVTDAAFVRQGDLLMELDNPDLTYRLRRLQIALQQNELRRRQAVDQHDASAAMVLRERHAAIVEQMGQLHRQLDGLKLVAPRHGYVIAGNLSELTGTYVHEGDELLTIAEPFEKELVAIAHQDDIEEVRASLGSAVPIRQAHFAIIGGTVERIDPRATNRLPAASLSALEGGPLPVRGATAEDSQPDDEAVRLIDPHFPVHIQLDRETAATVAVGMRMQTAFGYRTDPLLRRLTTAVRRMWHSVHEGVH
jgi:putative peptide zinc metalloprotease protein